MEATSGFQNVGGGSSPARVVVAAPDAAGNTQGDNCQTIPACDSSTLTWFLWPLGYSGAGVTTF